MHSPIAAKTATRTEYRALGIGALLAAFTFVRIALPLASGLFLGALVAFTLKPVHERLLRWTSRPALAAFLCAAFAWLFVTGGLGGLGYLLISRGAALSQQMPGALAPGGPVDRSTNAASEKLGDYGIHSPTIDNHLHHALEEIEGYAASVAGKAAVTAFGFLMTMFFMVITTYFVLRQWSRLAHWLAALLPLRPAHTHKLVTRLRLLGREAMLGTLFLGLLQGILAGVGFAMTGVPEPAFFGAMTAVASTLPALGTFLVWAPLGAYLIGSGKVAAGVLELCWGFFVVVMLCDGFVRPTVVGRHSKMGLLPTLIGLFGGLELIGFMGLLIGPTFVGLALAVLRMYARERSAQRRLLARRAATASTDSPEA